MLGNQVRLVSGKRAFRINYLVSSSPENVRVRQVACLEDCRSCDSRRALPEYSSVQLIFANEGWSSMSTYPAFGVRCTTSGGIGSRFA